MFKHNAKHWPTHMPVHMMSKPLTFQELQSKENFVSIKMVDKSVTLVKSCINWEMISPYKNNNTSISFVCYNPLNRLSL